MIHVADKVYDEINAKSWDDMLDGGCIKPVKDWDIDILEDAYQGEEFTEDVCILVSFDGEYTVKAESGSGVELVTDFDPKRLASEGDIEHQIAENEREQAWFEYTHRLGL